MYDFFLDKCLLPVPPDKLSVKINNANKTMTLINDGEVNFLKTAKLSEIEFECLLPQTKYPFAVYKDGFRNAEYFLGIFEKLKTDNKPFQFIVTRTRPNGRVLFSTNMTVSLESYTITEQSKDNSDVRVKIKLKQYREFKTKTVNITIVQSATPVAATQTTRAASTVQQTTPVVIGSEVVVNGRLHGSSYADAPGKTLSDYRGKVNFINLKGSCPYHITTPKGGWLGWVAKDNVKVVS